MINRARSTVAKYPMRKARERLVRVEVSVAREDARLVRQVAAALSDPTRQAATRAFLQRRFAKPGSLSLKALLASAPFEEIDLHRSPDVGRDVAL
jgi:hypothetical protein